MAADKSRARALRRLLLSLWVGGLATIDLVETPTRFAVKEVDRNQTIAIGRRVFASLNRMEVGLGALLLPLLRGKDAYASRQKIGPMWAIALGQLLVLQPKMRHAGEGLDYADRDRSDPRFARHRRLHRVYVALDGLKLALGVWAVLSDE
jgi:hypothetical protein